MHPLAKHVPLAVAIALTSCEEPPPPQKSKPIAVKPAVVAPAPPAAPAPASKPVRRELAEKPPPAPRRPGAVRIARVLKRKTSPAEILSVACRADERLVGGGCDIKGSYEHVDKSYPSAPDPADTYGGKWNCSYDGKYSDIKVEAYALCQYAPAPAKRTTRGSTKPRRTKRGGRFKNPFDEK